MYGLKNKETGNILSIAKDGFDEYYLVDDNMLPYWIVADKSFVEAVYKRTGRSGTFERPDCDYNVEVVELVIKPKERKKREKKPVGTSKELDRAFDVFLNNN